MVSGHLGQPGSSSTESQFNCHHGHPLAHSRSPPQYFQGQFPSLLNARAFTLELSGLLQDRDSQREAPKQGALPGNGFETRATTSAVVASLLAGYQLFSDWM